MDALIIYKTVGIIITSYLLGAVPFCYIIGRVHSRKKLTEIGDRNPGGWNLLFNVSKSWGFVGMFFDVFKGFIVYFLALKFTNIEIVALLAGCAAVAGHNYSPYLKFTGGKGIATTLGFLLAIHPLSIIAFAAGILSGIFLIKNMIWGVMLGIITSCAFLWIFKNSPVYLILAFLLIIIIIPKHINYSKSFGVNFKFRKEKTVKDLFTPKIR